MGSPSTLGGSDVGALAAGTSRKEGPLLVVDDEPDLSELLAELLAQEGYAVEVVQALDEALRRLDLRPTPRLVLLDWRLGNGRAPALLAQLETRAPRVRVLICTGAEWEARAFLSRTPCRVVVGLVRKPFSAASLLEAVKGALVGRGEQASQVEP